MVTDNLTKNSPINTNSSVKTFSYTDDSLSIDEIIKMSRSELEANLDNARRVILETLRHRNEWFKDMYYYEDESLNQLDILLDPEGKFVQDSNCFTLVVYHTIVLHAFKFEELAISLNWDPTDRRLLEIVYDDPDINDSELGQILGIGRQATNIRRKALEKAGLDVR